MKFTDAELLMTLMLAEVHQVLKINNGVNSKLVSEAIYSENTWAIEWDVQLPWTGGDSTPDYVNHVADVLDMWTFIENGYAALSAPDKQQFLTQTQQKGAPSFPGFDGNDEAKCIGAARMLINHMNRFTNFAGRDLNSHHSTIDRSKRMLGVFSPILPTLGLRSGGLTLNELVNIFNA